MEIAHGDSSSSSLSHVYSTAASIEHNTDSISEYNQSTVLFRGVDL
jgi:hypothetical protein